jgi:predicted nucleic acid-binding protein
VGNPSNAAHRAAGSRTAGDGRRLASLAIEHGATLYTTDRDFSRFPGLAFTNTLLHARGDG